MYGHHPTYPMNPYAQPLNPYAYPFTMPPPAAPFSPPPATPSTHVAPPAPVVPPAPAATSVPPAPPAPAPTPAPAATPAPSLFPKASLPGTHNKMPRSTNEIIQGNIRLLRHQRGTPGSKEYIYNQEKITKAPDKEFRLDYVDIDALADPTKFDPKLASHMSSFSASITNMVTHIKQYDLTAPIMVPIEIDHINTIVSDEKYNLLTDYPRFSRDDIAVWTVFYKMQPVDSTDYDTDNLLQDYIFKCLTGRLRTEVTEEFYELPDDEQGAPSLIYMALTKLHSHSRACVQTLQGSITNFKLS